jgi:sigma-E factor negative regulatory protein RseC
MEKQTGIVQSTPMEGKARVIVARRSACNHCGALSGCCITAGPNRMEIEARNPVGAAPGDTVTLRISTNSLIKGAAILYLLPLGGLMVGAFIGGVLQSMIGIGETAMAVLGGLGGLILGVLVSVFLSRKMSMKEESAPVIDRVVSRAPAANESDKVTARLSTAL